ncbi:MAG: FkbM family methyltransferase [Clostridia bacterium]|nr:FkbM family methyltransferase [Clostridia bacterium]
MPNRKFTLPEYPVESDLWDELARLNKPIVVYGMGNGADKLLSRFEKYGICASDIFASDGFVRGHSFHGMRVKSFSEIKAEYSDFVVVLSFASNREEVLEMLTDIDKNYDLYIPDMPVAGEEYFDKDFYNDNYHLIKEAYASLCDDASRDVFCSLIRYKLSGRMSDLMAAVATRDELYSLISCKKCYVDVGAYNGDTVREVLSYCPGVKKIIAIEPDLKNYKRLLRMLERDKLKDLVTPINAAASDKNSTRKMISSGNRNSSLASTSSYESRMQTVEEITLDSLKLDACDYIKYDVEGEELSALVGARETIERNHPTLLVSAYHRSCDIFSLILYLRQAHPEYSLYIRRLRCVPAWEIDIVTRYRGT